VRKYSVIFTTSASRDLESLPKNTVERIEKSIVALARNPRPRGTRKLRSIEGMWRIRVGDYRVFYAVDDKEKTVDVLGVKHRGKAY